MLSSSITGTIRGALASPPIADGGNGLPSIAISGTAGTGGLASVGAISGAVPGAPTEWKPLMVDMDDILEWPPDCEDDVYDEKLLWLSENLCLGDFGTFMAPIGGTPSARKLGRLAVSWASSSPSKPCLVVWKRVSGVLVADCAISDVGDEDPVREGQPVDDTSA
jgi:hypothetical protein